MDSLVQLPTEHSSHTSPGHSNSSHAKKNSESRSPPDLAPLRRRISLTGTASHTANGQREPSRCLKTLLDLASASNSRPILATHSTRWTPHLGQQFPNTRDRFSGWGLGPPVCLPADACSSLKTHLNHRFSTPGLDKAPLCPYRPLLQLSPHHRPGVYSDPSPRMGVPSTGRRTYIRPSLGPSSQAWPGPRQGSDTELSSRASAVAVPSRGLHLSFRLSLPFSKGFSTAPHSQQTTGLHLHGAGPTKGRQWGSSPRRLCTHPSGRVPTLACTLPFTHLQALPCERGHTRTPARTFTQPRNHRQTRSHECSQPHSRTKRHVGPHTYRCSWVPWWLAPSLGHRQHTWLMT